MLTCLLVYCLDEKKFPDAIKFIDPCLALLALSIIIVMSINLLNNLTLILLQGIPKHIPKTEKIKEEIFKQCVNDVKQVHEFHIWCPEPNRVIATVHVMFYNFEVSCRNSPGK